MTASYDGSAAPEPEVLPSHGAKTGPIMAAVITVVLLLGVLTDGLQRDDLPVLAGLGLVIGLTWALYVRPRLILVGDDLHLRGAFEDVVLPLAAVEELNIRRVFVAHTGAGRYISTAQSRPLRKMLFAREGDRPADLKAVNPADFLEDKLRRRAADARDRAGIKPMSDEQLALAQQVTKRRAWPVIGLLGGLFLALVLSLL